MVRKTSCGTATASTWYGWGLSVVRTNLKLSPFSCHNQPIEETRSGWRELLQQPMMKAKLVDTKKQTQIERWNPPLWFRTETKCKTTASSVPVQRSNDTPLLQSPFIAAAKQRVKISMNLPFGLLNNEDSCQCRRRSYSTTSTTAKGDDDKNNSEDYKDNYNNLDARRVAQLDRLDFEEDAIEAVWRNRYEELWDYSKLHGNCMVPENFPENPELGTWVRKQRQEYKRRKEGKLNRYFTEERIRLLEEIGFDWDPMESAWMERYHELVEYAKCHGNCIVPQNYSENPELGMWVKHQRQEYKRRKEGKLNRSFTEERIRLLEEIGFDWDPMESAWMERYHELVEYAKCHGNCIVPQNYSENPELGMWVKHQRQEYKRRKEGKLNRSFTEERIRLLEEIGFDWDPWESAWMERYHELVEYAKCHGNCMVPQNYPENPELAIWVMNQRPEYKRRKEGKLNRYFTEERIRLLEEIGFDWDPWESAWMERYHELVEYAKCHGNCIVPRNYPENPELGRWVNTQRRLYKQFQEGRSCGMTEERIAMLEHVGFVWNVRAFRGKVVALEDDDKTVT